MNGWNGFAINPNIGMAGLNMPVPAPNIIPGPPIGAGFSMPQGAQPAGWHGYNGMAAGAGIGGATGSGGAPGWFGIQGLGKNIGTLQGGLQTLGGFAQLWNANQMTKLAKQSFNHQKGLLDTNLANQIKAYNLSIDDKFRSRAVVESTSNADRDANIDKWRARDERRG